VKPRFWDEKWQQREKLSRIQKIQDLQQKTLRDKRKYVKDYWKEGEMDGIWWKWKRLEEWDAEKDQEQQKLYMEEVGSRKIKVRTGKHILRSGNSMKGTFSVKETYYLMEQQ